MKEKPVPSRCFFLKALFFSLRDGHRKSFTARKQPFELTSTAHCAKSSGKSLIFSRLRVQTFDPDMVAKKTLTEVLQYSSFSDDQDRCCWMTRESKLSQFFRYTRKFLLYLNNKCMSVTSAQCHIVDPIIRETNCGIFGNLIRQSLSRLTCLFQHSQTPFGVSYPMHNRNTNRI